MKLTTLGTGTVTPHALRTSACHYLEATEATEEREAPPFRLLLDCGAGSLHRMAQHGIPWRDIDCVAITHFHADHWGELAALIFAMKYGATEPRKTGLTLIGPVGLRDRLTRLAQAFGEWVAEPGFPLDLVELIPLATHHSPRPGIRIACCKTPHTPESVAFAVEAGGARLVYTGDTGPSDALGDWARHCDLLLSECSLPDSMAMDMHLTPRQAGRLAARADAKRLVLTHLYPPVESVDIVAEARQAYGGPVSVAADGSTFETGSR